MEDSQSVGTSVDTPRVPRTESPEPLLNGGEGEGGEEAVSDEKPVQAPPEEGEGEQDPGPLATTAPEEDGELEGSQSVRQRGTKTKLEPEEDSGGGGEMDGSRPPPMKKASSMFSGSHSHGAGDILNFSLSFSVVTVHSRGGGLQQNASGGKEKAV